MKNLLTTSFLCVFIFIHSNICAQYYPPNSELIETDEMSIGIVPGLPLNAWAYDSEGNLQFCGLGLWMSGIYERVDNNDIIFYANSKYGYLEDSYGPGPVVDVSEYSESFNEDWTRLFPVNRAEIKSHIEDFENNGVLDDEITDNILYYPANGNPFFFEKYGFALPNRSAELLAPFTDRNNNGMYDPHLGDFPRIKGTSAYYFMSNTINQFVNENMDYPFEIHTMVYFDENEDCGKTVDFDVKINYLGELELINFKMGVWMDQNNANQSNNHPCEEENYVGFLPSENLSFFYGKVFDECDEPSTSFKYGRMLHQEVGGLNFNTNSQESSCVNTNGLYEPPDENIITYNLLNGKHRDGLSQTYGGNGYNIGSIDTAKELYNHENYNGKEPWYDSEEELYCNPQNSEPRSRSSLTGFGDYTLNKGDILDVHATMYYFLAEDWETPSKERIIAQYDNIRGGCTDTLEWNEISFETEDVLIYPNPVNDYLYLFVEDNVQVKAEILTITGILMEDLGDIDLNPNMPHKIDVTNLNPGNYFLRLVYPDSEVVTKSFVVF